MPGGQMVHKLSARLELLLLAKLAAKLDILSIRDGHNAAAGCRPHSTLWYIAQKMFPTLQGTDMMKFYSPLCLRVSHYIEG